MLRRHVGVGALAVGLIFAGAMVAAGPARAKGATKAVITGPGLARPIVVADAGEPGQSGKLATLAEQSELFTVLFGGSVGGPERTLGSSPRQVTLGRRYTVVYTVPGDDPKPGDKFGRIRQNLYPYATGGPLSYTPPAQHGFGQPLQASGWLRADPRLVRTLTRLGVPTRSTADPVRAITGSRLAGTGARASIGPAIAWAIAAIVAGGALMLGGRKHRVRR